MITVLMAVWQGIEFLEEQLESVLGQTVKVDRIVVSDDGSDDGTWELLERYRENYPEVFKLIRHTRQENTADLKGAAANFFNLMDSEEAGGNEDGESSYWFLSDQDDIWLPGKVELMLNRMNEIETEYGTVHPILLHSDMKVADAGGQVLAESFFAYQKINFDRVEVSEILVENPVTGGAVMMNAPLLELMKSPPEFCVMHDWWMALAASCFGRIAVMEQPLSMYRQHGGNVMGAKQTGSVEELKRRLYRQAEVQDNYRNMFRQAECFLMQYGTAMSEENRSHIQGFLSLPLRSPIRRFYTIRRHSLYKSSLLQSLAQCFTIKR